MADPDLRAGGGVALEDRKRAMRAAVAGQLRGRSPSATAAESAAAHLVKTRLFHRSRSLGLYGALPDELSTVPVFRSARDAGKQCLFPRTTSAGELAFVPAARWEDLRCGRYGVLEPDSDAPAVELAGIDLILVPGVAFDRAGRRLGRGGGHYDRALALRFVDRRPFVIGFVESCRLVDEVPTGSLDQAVDAVLTEAGWITLRGAEPGLVELR